MSFPGLFEAKLPTEEDVKLWRTERERLALIVEEIRQRTAMLDRLIETTSEALALGKPQVSAPAPSKETQKSENPVEAAPPEVAKKVAKPTKPKRKAPHRMRDSDSSWPAIILRIVESSPQPPSYEEIRKEIYLTSLGKTLERTSSAFYGTIKKLEDRGILKRHMGRVFTRSGYDAHMAAVREGIVSGRAPIVIKTHGSPQKAAIVEFLSSVGSAGATTSSIMEELQTNPILPSMSEKNGKTVIYNLLARMAKRGELIKEGEVYRLPPKENEPPTSKGDGGSESDEAPTSSKDSQQAFRRVG
ncbi:MAG TPA: hypothetical protein VNT30_12705 [Stellaceae bacterium]|nr:hypothetical protein [Stellaceae bacterium]